jgi:hypothetical protein
MERLYRIEEFATTGWEPMDRNLTREVCTERLEMYIAEGRNPKHLRLQIENESNP